MAELRGYLLEGSGRKRFFRGLTGTSLQKAIDAGVRRLKKHPRVKTFAITDSVSAETKYYDYLGNRVGYQGNSAFSTRCKNPPLGKWLKAQAVRLRKKAGKLILDVRQPATKRRRNFAGYYDKQGRFRPIRSGVQKTGEGEFRPARVKYKPGKAGEVKPRRRRKTKLRPKPGPKPRSRTRPKPGKSRKSKSKRTARRR